VTAALPYANGPIHLGHVAGVYLPADVFVRFQKMKGNEVVFICGSDDHGVPITIEAERQKKKPTEIVSTYHQQFQKSFEKLGVQFDNFSQTSREIHHQTAQEFFRRLNQGGYLVQHRIEQLFCLHCQRFLPDRYIVGVCPHCHQADARGDQCEKCGNTIDQLELVNPICKVCGATPVRRETFHWFFQLNQFQKKLEEWITSKKNWKENVIHYCHGWFREGLTERAITRDLRWGIPVPFPEGKEKVIYVWFEAPIGYISSTKEWAQRIGKPDEWKKYWLDPSSKLIHFIGKDNIVFHAITWPATLLAHGEYVLPENIPANEFLNIEGRKLSTSGNWAVWIDDVLNEFPADMVRYSLASVAPETKDADFSWSDFQARINNELADIFGNFVNRSFTFINKNFGDQIPSPGLIGKEERAVSERLENLLDKLESHYGAFELRQATFTLMEICRMGNKYFNDKQPWVTLTQNRQDCQTTLYFVAQILRAIAIGGFPILPISCQSIQKALHLEAGAIQWNDAKTLEIRPGTFIKPPHILFEKIDNQKIEQQKNKLGKPIVQMSGVNSVTQIDIDTFNRIELRIGEIKSAEKVEKSDKLVKLTVDLGGDERQIVAGIAQHYTPQELPGRKIVVVVNLKPAKIRGLLSEGMLLAASDENGSLVIINPEKTIKNGSRVK